MYITHTQENLNVWIVSLWPLCDSRKKKNTDELTRSQGRAGQGNKKCRKMNKAGKRTKRRLLFLTGHVLFTAANDRNHKCFHKYVQRDIDSSHLLTRSTISGGSSGEGEWEGVQRGGVWAGGFMGAGLGHRGHILYTKLRNACVREEGGVNQGRARGRVCVCVCVSAERESFWTVQIQKNNVQIVLASRHWTSLHPSSCILQSVSKTVLVVGRGVKKNKQTSRVETVVTFFFRQKSQKNEKGVKKK